MKEYGVKASWTKLYTIRYPDNYELSLPLFTYNKGEILLAFKSTLRIYDPKNDSITYPEVPDDEVTGFYDRIKAELCIESLVCPDLPNEDRKMSERWQWDRAVTVWVWSKPAKASTRPM
ncbi:hypothetical protein EJD97_017597 [Solanum chilense]|uniref:F-box associated domain-containing protein n=1 Tax=Solanum chilense TaxID=4083 RepID=A0A6N2AG54_SOLCI|nr:hypothetical protein EJD97_017597 [Solanum chilense]